MRVEYPEDIARLRAAVPEIALLADQAVASLYSDFSDEGYCAGWMHLSEDLIIRFRHWVRTGDILWGPLTTTADSKDD